MSSYQYGKSHCEDNTVVRLSYLHNGIFPILVRCHLYIESGPNVLSNSNLAIETMVFDFLGVMVSHTYGPRPFKNAMNHHDQ